MYFRRFYDEQLAQASYLIGCQRNGTAIVIDPIRVVTRYLDAAAAEGLTIVAVTETHIHADFLSGSRQLAAETGARIHLSGCGPDEWQYGYRNEPNVSILRDRDVITIGNIAITAVHTPGHTPEHLSFLVTDGAVASEPMGIVTGDFVFVGDVGRPDLLEKAAHVAAAAEPAARALYQSLAWFRTLPDHLQVWPGHGAGSACGKGLGAVPQTTVGYERRFNWAFGAESEDEFVRQVLAGQPDPPRYFGRMKRINRDGAPLLDGVKVPRPLDANGVAVARDRGAVLVDLRSAEAFAGGHIPEAINIPLSRSLLTYAGSVLPYDRPLDFIVPAGVGTTVATLFEGLVSIGFDLVDGVADASVVNEWKASGRPMATLDQLPATSLAARAKQGATVVDVRNRAEWEAGHWADAKLIPLPELVDRMNDLPRDGDILVHCQSGARSAIAASLLAASGFSRVSNVLGGYAALSRT